MNDLGLVAWAGHRKLKDRTETSNLFQHTHIICVHVELFYISGGCTVRLYYQQPITDTFLSWALRLPSISKRTCWYLIADCKSHQRLIFIEGMCNINTTKIPHVLSETVLLTWDSDTSHWWSSECVAKYHSDGHLSVLGYSDGIEWPTATKTDVGWLWYSSVPA